MYSELTFNVGGREQKAFIQNGFYTDVAPTNHIHKHTYTEVHLISGGSAVFTIEEETVSADEDTLLLLPSSVFHSCTYIAPDALHSAFQIDCQTDEIAMIPIPRGIISAFFDEIKKSKTTNDHTAICAYMSLLCSYFCKDKKIAARRINDPGFLICEFFSNRYSSDVNLCDLAQILCLSERQTERLVIKLTGRTFCEELATTRIAMAKRLQQSSSMSLKEISEYVGYHSYSGFWKAMKKAETDKH